MDNVDSPDYRLWVAFRRRTTKDDVVPNGCCGLHWTHQEIALDVCKKIIKTRKMARKVQLRKEKSR